MPSNTEFSKISQKKADLIQAAMMKIGYYYQHITDDIMKKFLFSETNPSNVYIPFINSEGKKRFKLKEGLIKYNNNVLKISENGEKLFTLLDNVEIQEWKLVQDIFYYEGYGKAFLNTRVFQTIWLTRDSGKMWLKTQTGRKWLGTPSGKAWTETDSGKEWLSKDFRYFKHTISSNDLYKHGSAIQRTLAKEDQEEQQKRVEFDIDTAVIPYYTYFKSHKPMEIFFESSDGKIFLKMLNNPEKRNNFLKSDIGKQVLKIGPFQNKWLHTPSGTEWREETDDGMAWMKSNDGITWCNRLEDLFIFGKSRPKQCDMTLKESIYNSQHKYNDERVEALSDGLAYGGGGRNKHRSHTHHYKRKTHKKRKTYKK